MTGCRMEIGDIVQETWEVEIDRTQLVEFGDGLIVAIEFFQNDRAMAPRIQVVRTERKRLVVARERLLEAAEIGKRMAPIDVGVGVAGLQYQRSRIARDGLGRPAQRQERTA